jgi:dipeptidyl aminopeptidase/acylaminoacyl peptidase
MQNDPLETEVLSESYLSSVQRVLLDSALDNASRILVSTLVLQGKEDVMVKAEGIKQLYEALAASGKELVLFDDAGHWFYDALSPAPPRDKFDSAKKAQFIDTVVCWLRNH